MAASVLRLAAAVLALCAAAQTVAASPQDRAGEGGLDCGSRLSALVACELPDQLLDVDRGRCCAAILAFHTAGCMWYADVCSPRLAWYAKCLQYLGQLVSFAHYAAALRPYNTLIAMRQSDGMV